VPASTADLVSKEEKREFMSVFPDIVRELSEHAKKYDSKVAAKWYAKALQYNVPLGKKSRGLATAMAYRMLASQSQLTPENLRLVYYLGWCIEMVSEIYFYFRQKRVNLFDCSRFNQCS
jgi:farnesyl diphosphate synthase